MLISLLICLLACCSTTVPQDDIPLNPPAPDRGDKEWKLVWSDEFDYENGKLDDIWVAADGEVASHIDCSRWRSNVTTKDGYLYLTNKKENKGGREWTSGSIWTKKKFRYGRFECRYKYASATGVNNSFWLFAGNNFELDINEGKYPNIIDMTMHRWSGEHKATHRGYYVGGRELKPGYTFDLPSSIATKKIRLVSKTNTHFQLRELRAFPKSLSYPDVLSDAMQMSSSLPNYAKEARVIECSGTYDTTDGRKPYNAIDGTTKTSWTTQSEGDKFLVLEWTKEKNIGCFQVVNGWQDESNIWWSFVPNFKIDYWDGSKWVEAVDFDYYPKEDLSKDFHVYACEWNEKEIIWFYDGKEVRRDNNVWCHSEAPIYLSAAIASWVGKVTDAIDGTSMIVDWVKVYERK